MLRTFVCALLQLAVVRGLLHEVQDGLGEAFIGDGPGYSWLASGSKRVVRWHLPAVACPDMALESVESTTDVVRG